MQTFLPYPSFEESVKVLDNKRLGKQRVEVLQILQVIEKGNNAKGWKNHPAVKMWRGYEGALAIYGIEACKEWTRRGYKDTCQTKIWFLWSKLSRNPWEDPIYPPWFGDDKFHSSHRSNLLRKDILHYSQWNWKEPQDLPYVWPDKNL